MAHIDKRAKRPAAARNHNTHLPIALSRRQSSGSPPADGAGRSVIRKTSDCVGTRPENVDYQLSEVGDARHRKQRSHPYDEGAL